MSVKTFNIIDLNNYDSLSGGNHNLYVKAESVSGEYSSSDSSTIVFTKLNPPQNLSTLYNNLSFNTVDNADEYLIYADNIYLGQTNN